METKNLGLVKSIFRQSTPPDRTDVYWYDTINNIIKIYSNDTLKWIPNDHQFVGALTDNTPTSAEISSVIGLTASDAGRGFKASIKDSSGSSLIYQIESDGTDWFYSVMTKAL
jgi:hypothetical protein